MGLALDELILRVAGLPEDQKREVTEAAFKETAHLPFIPSPGPQTEAYFSQADILLFGGEPGGGKTGLILGLALNAHERSLIVRKQFTDLEGVIDNAKEILGTSDGFIGGTRPKYKKPDGGVIHFEGMNQGEKLDTSKQGTPHDFIGVDEGAQLPETAVRMLMGWNRTKKAGQRCRMVIASNPPVDSVGDWLGVFFAPWLDPAHSNPAKPGELRWFIMNGEGVSQEVDGPEIVIIDGKEYSPHSRTFIPAGLDDNPYINAEDYRKRLQAMPEPYRTMLTSGNFLAARSDQDCQCIPTDWVREAQARWTPQPPEGVPMCAISCDPAGGGKDENIISPRYDGWYATLIAIPGKDTPHGTQIGGHIMIHRHDNADVVIDMGGGYGGAAYSSLTENGIAVKSHKGSEGSKGRTADKKLGFFNKRSEVYWKFREALDPSQPGGSPIALPPDPMLVSDLTAPTFEVTSRGIKVEPKEDVQAKLNRSPDRGDAVVNCWSVGKTIANVQGGWKAHNKNKAMPTINLGHSNQRRKR
jgi:hypothetical protein